jgi:hypothetical protein
MNDIYPGTLAAALRSSMVGVALAVAISLPVSENRGSLTAANYYRRSCLFDGTGSYGGFHPAVTIERSTPHLLRVVTDLPVTVLASMAGVSRQTYHNWLAGESIAPENDQRLTELLGVLMAVREHQPNLRLFLRTEFFGTTPLELVRQREYGAVLAIAQDSHIGARQADDVRPISWSSPISPIIPSLAYRRDPGASVDERTRISDAFDDAAVPLGSVVVAG